MNLFSRLFNSRDKPKNHLGGGFSFLFGGTASGKLVNEQTAMQTSAVYACVRILSESIAGLPIRIYRYRNDGGKEKVIDHPLYYLLHDEPNPEMTSFIFRETLMAHILLWGNGYAQIVRNGRGHPTALYPLLPSKMTVDRVVGKLLYTYQGAKGELKLRREDVLHIPGLGFDGIIGYSPIAMAKNAVGMALATEEYGAKFFANGASPSGVLEHPGTVKDIQRLKESWNANYQGSANAHKIGVLEEGLKFHQIGIPPEQAQFLQTRKFQLNEIARIYRIPPHMIGDLEKSSFSNIEQQSLEFIKYCLDPWVVRWEQSLQLSLLLPSEKKNHFIRFNLDGLLRGDYNSRMNGYSAARQNGWLNANEIRELENMNRIPAEEGGDLYMVNGNMVRLTDTRTAGEKIGGEN